MISSMLYAPSMLLLMYIDLVHMCTFPLELDTDHVLVVHLPWYASLVH